MFSQIERVEALYAGALILALLMFILGITGRPWWALGTFLAAAGVVALAKFLGRRR
jgi:hypothetical protein